MRITARVEFAIDLLHNPAEVSRAVQTLMHREFLEIRTEVPFGLVEKGDRGLALTAAVLRDSDPAFASSALLAAVDAAAALEGMTLDEYIAAHRRHVDELREKLQATESNQRA